MRTGIQQALTQEAASVVKQAINLARRRGHAQVTPLHVASAMLASSTGLLRRACLQSHSHPLQCKALELCFNVALNRLPASNSCALLSPVAATSSPLYPALSNALVAAFKRAQAHQRRGSIENQQQPILALKIEVEQLVISILDDPSVSRVMREAGFSSTQVKNRVEQSVSLDISPQSSQSKDVITAKPGRSVPSNKSQSQPSSHFSQFCGVTLLGKPMFSHQTKSNNDDDVTSVLNTLVSKKRNLVIVGECVSTLDSVVRGVIDKIERGHTPSELKAVKFVSLPILSFLNVSKEEVEQKISELRCIVKSNISRGIILYFGDLKWVSEFWSNYGEQKPGYCSLEQVVTEIKRLVRCFGEFGRFWLIGIAKFSTYIKCKTGNPPLETIWELYPLTIPIGSLSLTLNLDSDAQSHSRSKASTFASNWPLIEPGIDMNLTSCTECSVNFTPKKIESNYSSLPSWLQQCKQDTISNDIEDNKECLSIGDLCKKWNSFCSSAHKQPHNTEKSIRFALSPTSSVSISSNENIMNNNQLDQSSSHQPWPVIFEPLRKEGHPIWMSESNNEGSEGNLRNYMKPDLLSNPNSSPNSASSSEATEDTEALQSFKEYNTENLKILCDALEKKVPWQKNVVQEIVTTILECRSGMRNGKCKASFHREDCKEETWFFFLGVDAEAKEKIARELARLVFGSQSKFVSISLSNYYSNATRSDSTDQEPRKNKRLRDEPGSRYYERLSLALNENPHRVFFLEDLEQVDYNSRKGIKKAIESGRVTLPDGEIVPLKDSIVIFCSETYVSASRACSPPPKMQKGAAKDDQSDSHEKKDDNNQVLASLDLNIALEHDIFYDKEDGLVSEHEILEYVDGLIIFKNQDLM